MKTPSEERAKLMDLRQHLIGALDECVSTIKRDHMSWVLISSEFGHLLGQEQPLTYAKARKLAAEHNREINWDEDKAYRDQISIAGWRWLDTGELVHPGSENGFYEVKSSLIEAPE